MPLGDNKDLGFIRRNRDLVELYYGLRMVALSKESQLSSQSTQTLAIAVDPRRVKLDLVLANKHTTTACQFLLGSPLAFANSSYAVVVVGPNNSIQISRNFLFDLDSITDELDYQTSGGTPVLSIREVILTPPPVDEAPR